MATPDFGIPPDQQQLAIPPSQHPSQMMVLTGIPVGLEYLAYVDTLYVHQELELLEIFTGLDCYNRYCVKNSQGQRIYLAAENSDCCARYWMKNKRPFEINVLDPAGTAVITVTRSCTCGLYYCPKNYGNMIEVKAGVTGELLGTVEVVYRLSCCKATFNLKNANGDIVFTCQTGTCCLCCKCGLCCSCCSKIVFDLLTPDGTNVGSVSKFFSGFQEKKPESFGAQFPLDLDPGMKAVVLGTIFLIDFTYFEE